jgi:hypothetical protein
VRSLAGTFRKEKAIAAARALALAKTKLGVAPELRWIRPDATARLDPGRKTWSGDKAPTYCATEDITGQADLLNNYMLIRADLSLETIVRSCLHEAQHFYDAKQFGIPSLVGSERDKFECRAHEFENAHYARLC